MQGAVPVLGLPIAAKSILNTGAVCTGGSTKAISHLKMSAAFLWRRYMITASWLMSRLGSDQYNGTVICGPKTMRRQRRSLSGRNKAKHKHYSKQTNGAFTHGVLP
jgi:hypothetical protein